eukprot:TRINITY_DN2697_c0_g1_i4.p1 TRINITY_DN2697_c0_g1~~TRINITY_DN2697_c0_g1_i4.p1  ORF type:complete len:129 (-),score=11.15 TRINITY_DN2697_c0_g1_i4:477-863(-)
MCQNTSTVMQTSSAASTAPNTQISKSNNAVSFLAKCLTLSLSLSLSTVSLFLALVLSLSSCLTTLLMLSYSSKVYACERATILASRFMNPSSGVSSDVMSVYLLRSIPVYAVWFIFARSAFFPFKYYI